MVVDIGRAGEALKPCWPTLHYRNLDELPELAGQNTTTEFVARLDLRSHGRGWRKGELGPGSASACGDKVTLHESHVAWASYETSVKR